MARTKTTQTISVNAIFKQIADQVNKEVNTQMRKEIRKWAVSAGRNVQQEKGLKAVNEIVAEGARRVTYQAYVNSGIGKGESYRYGDRGKWRRYSNGKMEEALLAKETIRANKGGISFIDKGEMDKYAKQWYRLNFGTKGGGRGGPPTVPMEFFGVPLGKSPSLDFYQQSKSFSMPEGIWSSTFAAKTIGTSFEPPGAGKNAFYAIGKRSRRPKVGKGKVSRRRKSRDTKQIDGAGFLDAGVNYINVEYPNLLEKLIRSWLTVR